MNSQLDGPWKQDREVFSLPSCGGRLGRSVEDRLTRRLLQVVTPGPHLLHCATLPIFGNESPPVSQEIIPMAAPLKARKLPVLALSYPD